MAWIGVTKKRKKHLIQLFLVNTPNRLKQITPPPPGQKPTKQTNMNHLSLPRFKQGFVIKQNWGITWNCLYKPPLSKETVSGTDKYFKYSKIQYYTAKLLQRWITILLNILKSIFCNKKRWHADGISAYPSCHPLHSTVWNRSSKGDSIIEHFFATYLQGFVIEQNAGIAWSRLYKPRFLGTTVSGISIKWHQ